MWTGKVDKLIQIIQGISQTATAEKLNIGLAHVNEIIEGLANKNVCLMGAVTAHAWNEESKTGSMPAITLLLLKCE